MFPTSKSIPDTSSYLRKKQPLIADQPPLAQAGEATAQEETGPQQQPRQPLPPRLSPPPPQTSSETTSLQRPASAPQITPSAQRNDASQGPPPSLGDVQPFQRHTASDQQQNLPRLPGSRIPQTTIHYRLPDARTTQSSTARSPEVRQDAARGQISSPGSTTPATGQPPLRPPQTAQATYLRRLTELGQPLGALPRILQPQPGPLSAATRPPYATPTAAQSRDQSTPQQPSSTAVGSPHLDAGSPRPPGMPPVAAPPSLPDPVQEQQKLEKQAAISKNLTLQQQREKQRQDRLRGQGAGQAQQLAQQEAQLQPAQQRLEAARQTHAAFAGAPVRYENRGGSLVRIQSDASGVQKTLPVDPANPQEMAQAANWTRQHASAKAELAAAEAAHAPLAAGVQGLKDQHQKLAIQLIEEHRWAQSMQQRRQHGASGEAGPPPPFTPATADRHLLARLQAAGDPMAAVVKEEMTPPAVRQFQGRLDTAAPATPMTLLDVVTGGAPGSGARATLAEATAARDLTMKSMGVMDPKNVQLTPLPDGTQALHRPRSGSSAPLAIYDPKQKSLTVQAQNGVLSEEAQRMVRNIAGAPGSALESSMPVYFGHGPHATEAEFSSLVEAGKQAHEAARTPEERAAALGKLGLSPAGVKKQLEAGTLSFQQGRLLNGAFNGVMEHDSTHPGTQAALEEWVSHPKNQHMAQWLHEGTPEQRAYVAGQFFKQTRHRAEGSLLATPERMEEVRRGHLGGLHPDWGKPGAIAPGSAPDDGPAGLERIPLQGGGAAHMPSGTWTAHDYETLDQHPDIRKLPHAEREAAVDTRVILHERVGHDGLQTLLGSKDSKAQKHWEGLTQRIKPEELNAIASQEGYQHLKDNPTALAHEWFARQAEKSPHLLKEPGLLRDMWEAFKAQLRKVSNYLKDTDESHLDTHLHELLRHSRKAALRAPSASQKSSHPGITGGCIPLSTTSTHFPLAFTNHGPILIPITQTTRRSEELGRCHRRPAAMHFTCVPRHLTVAPFPAPLPA